MKKIMSLLAAVMLICPGCGGIAAAETLRTEVTREWIQEVYGFSDEDLEGVAVEEVAEALWWTRDEVQREFGRSGDRSSWSCTGQNTITKRARTTSSSVKGCRANCRVLKT